MTSSFDRAWMVVRPVLCVALVFGSFGVGAATLDSQSRHTSKPQSTNRLEVDEDVPDARERLDEDNPPGDGLGYAYRRVTGAYVIPGAARDGTWTWYHGNGAVAATGAYSHGKHVGEWQWWHPNGQRRALGRHDTEGQRTSAWVFWSDTGAVTEISRYQAGRLHGTRTRFHGNGSVASTRAYLDDKPSGTNRDWHDDGSLRCESAAGGNGWYVEFYPSGVVAVRGQLVAGQRAGLWMEYHPNGKIAGQGTYSIKDGEKADDWAYFPHNED